VTHHQLPQNSWEKVPFLLGTPWNFRAHKMGNQPKGDELHGFFMTRSTGNAPGVLGQEVKITMHQQTSTGFSAN